MDVADLLAPDHVIAKLPAVDEARRLMDLARRAATATGLPCGAGQKRPSVPEALRVGITFGGFLLAMALLGWALGVSFAEHLGWGARHLPVPPPRSCGFRNPFLLPAQDSVMHSHSLDPWRHEHVFLGEHHERNERRIWIVVGLTLAMMVGEIAGGTVFGSLALVADGWHMSTHAAALGISALAYLYARRHVRSDRFAFGTGKLGELAAFASAIILAMIALLIGYESVERLINPVPIAYAEAIAIAVLGLAVNLGSAWLLGRERHHHGHGNGHGGHGHGGHHAHDLNMRAAYIHVLADAATSVLAIVGLLAAGLFGWTWMDPIVGLVGTAVILRWAYGLVRDAGAVLLDTVPDPKLATAIRTALEIEGDRVTDLHLWRVGPGHMAAIVALVSDDPRPPAEYKARLARLHGLSHVTVEVARCGDDHSDPGHHRHAA